MDAAHPRIYTVVTKVKNDAIETDTMPVIYRTPPHSILGAALLSLFVSAAPSLAENSPSLGHAAFFTALAGKGIVNRGDSSIYGDIAVSPGADIEGVQLGVLKNGHAEAHTEWASLAQDSLKVAMSEMELMACGKDLGGSVADISLVPGVYCAASDLTVSGTLTLDGLGNPDSVFILKIGSNLHLVPLANIELKNGANPCNIYWRVGGRALLETESSFQGNILAAGSVALEHGAFLAGRVLARNGRILFNKNQVNSCPTPTASLEGRMVGNDQIDSNGRNVYSNFDLQCDAGKPQNLEISLGEKKIFQLTSVSSATCMDDPSVLPNPAMLNFDVMRGVGAGFYNGKPGYYASWTFTDADDSGKMDFSDITVRNSKGKKVWAAAGYLAAGNHRTYRSSDALPYTGPNSQR